MRYLRADLVAWVRHLAGKAIRLRRRHTRSKFGSGLLRDAMAMHEGKPFVDLLGEKVIAPLGLTDRIVRIDQGQRSRVAQPRNTQRKAVSRLDSMAWRGRDAWRSTSGGSRLASFRPTLRDTAERHLFRITVPRIRIARFTNANRRPDRSGRRFFKFREKLRPEVRHGPFRRSR
ncbi:hypothetical protein DKT77_03815 [Meridianimarinicoccus roseus]|uniref:Uncharacterized protein n=1 Tax=Meridianimarinicoccus roseus TaxID=2072018 RepID=A0A2V2LFT4_9RHOB|nr:hypothetical protein DKT77_03815 [Meridianimarinicoccus roseus]